jgi:hypothetical protein
MKNYKTATAFRTALEDRLRARARKSGVNPQRLWSLVAFDRLLARLLKNKEEHFVLKGGYAMELRIKTARVTKDVDLTAISIKAKGSGREATNEALLAELQALAGQDLGDFFGFVIGRPTMDLDNAPYGGARFPVETRMDGRTFVEFHLDVGVGDVITGPMEEIEGEDWLGFAAIPRPRFRMISREQQFAEKVHAYTLPREGRPNSRVKDLVDMVLLIQLGGMSKEALAKAIRATFERRGTHKLPSPLPAAPEDWAKPFTALAKECNLKHDAASALAFVNDYMPKA